MRLAGPMPSTMASSANNSGLPWLTYNEVISLAKLPTAMPTSARVSASVSLGLPHPDVERRLLDQPAEPTWPAPIDGADLDVAYRVVSAVRCQPDVGDYVMGLVHQAREGRDVWLSVRVPQTVLALSRAYAVLDSRDYVVPDDVQDAFRVALPHRLAAGQDAGPLVAQVLSQMPVPLGE